MKLKAGLKNKKERHFHGLLLLIALLLAGFLAGAVVEGLYELNTCRRELKGGNEIGSDVIDSRNIQIRETTVCENQRGNTEYTENQPVEGQPVTKRIHITIDERYINKFCYDYDSDEDFTAYIAVHTKNIYKVPEVRELQDVSRANLNESILNIKDYVTEIIIDVPTDVEIRRAISE